MNPHPTGLPPLLSLEPDEPARRILTDLTTGLAETRLHKPVELEVQAADRSGHWAFVRARVREVGGDALSLEGTPFAEAAAAGGVSDLVVALFRLDGDDWKMVDQAVLPSDVAWLDWPHRHGAPSQLLGIG